MTESEFLERFDRRLEQANAIMARNTEAFDRNTEAFERHERAFERHGQAFDDLRTFTRDLVRRNEVVFNRMAKDLEDLGDQVRANTQAVLAALDRLEPRNG